MLKKKLTNRELEERYQSGTLRLSQEKNDFLLPQVLEFINTKKWLNLHPEYQRRLIWDRKKRSLFIESILMNIPIPPIFLLEWEYSRYEVMDGQQRLSTIVEFYDNRFKLSGLEKWPELNGRTYADCPPIIQRGLDRRRISAVVLLAENLEFGNEKFDIRRMVFERLNTGGQNLNAQELRNCIYAGNFSKLLVELAGYDIFDDLWEIPRYSDHIRGSHVSSALADNALFKRMRDCEIVLRFFAFRKKSNIRGSVRSILDRTMSENMNIIETKADELRNIFISRIDLCSDMFGNKAFRLIDKNGNYQISQPLYDATMIAVDRLFNEKDSLVKNRKCIADALTAATKNEDDYEIIVARPNTADFIRQRLDLVENIFRSCL
jgi:hypothetical protein